MFLPRALQLCQILTAYFLTIEGPITWWVSARAEIWLRPPDWNIVVITCSISCSKFTEVRKHSQCACSRSFFSPGWNSVSITWDFFRFSGPFGQLKILARFEHTGLGFSARAELRPGLNPSLCNRQFAFQRICFRTRAEISARDEIRHVIGPWLKKFLTFCYWNN